MQLDQTRIVIRERDQWDLLDLSLHVIRAHGLQLLITSLGGAIPFAILNYWLLRDLPLSEAGDYWTYTWRMLLLVAFEMPLASAFSTMLLGQAMFTGAFDYRRIVQQTIESLPQLIWFQIILRAFFMPQVFFWGGMQRDFAPLLVLWMLLWLVPYSSWPYLNEAILLERNPLFRRPGSLSTWRRSRVLHARAGGDLFARVLAALTLGLLLVSALWLACWHFRGVLGDEFTFDRAMFTIYLPLSLWIIAGYFTVVRFLSYLDLRIRREGWEVELTLRAEADRLSRQHS